MVPKLIYKDGRWLFTTTGAVAATGWPKGKVLEDLPAMGIVPTEHTRGLAFAVDDLADAVANGSVPLEGELGELAQETMLLIDELAETTKRALCRTLLHAVADSRVSQQRICTGAAIDGHTCVTIARRPRELSLDEVASLIGAMIDLDQGGAKLLNREIRERIHHQTGTHVNRSAVHQAILKLRKQGKKVRTSGNKRGTRYYIKS